MTKLRQRLYQKDNYVQLSNSLKKSLTFSELYGIFYVRMINYYSNIKIIIVGIIFIISYFFIGYSNVLADIDVRYLGSIDKNYSIIKPSVKEESTETKPLEVSHPQHIETKYVTTRKEETNIKVTYAGITSKETYPAEERGPAVITILDPYHPKHKGMSLPYYKDREGLKIHPWVGVATKYEFKTQEIWSTNVLEAKQFGNISKSDLKKYTSLERKKIWEAKLSLHPKEALPKFVYTHHDEDIRREYEGKLEWANNRIWGEQNKYHDFKLDYTIPGLKYIGFLRIEPGYRRVYRYSDYIDKFKADQDRYSLALTSMPFDIGKLKLEYSYTDEDKDEPASLYGVSMTGNKIDEFFTELKIDLPRQRLKIIPSYKLKHEKWQLSGGLKETWNTHEAHLKFEKLINDIWEFHSDWRLIHLSRDRPSTQIPETIKTKGWDVENELYYELFDDFDLILVFGYLDMLDLDHYNAYWLGPKIRYYIPGLIDFGMGASYRDYYDIGDEEWMLFFRLSLFM